MNRNLPVKPTPAKSVFGEFETHEHLLTKECIDQLRDLVNRKASETELDTFIRSNPVVFSAIFHQYRTGHHEAIVIPGQVIKVRIGNTSRGLIPDFIIGGRNSDGFNWWIVEIKGVDQNMFTHNKSLETYLSAELNKGFCQLLEYLDFCSEYQSNLRDLFNLSNFREPRGLLIMGTEEELEVEQKRKLKAAWNRYCPKMEIRTYSWLCSQLENLYKIIEKK